MLDGLGVSMTKIPPAVWDERSRSRIRAPQTGSACLPCWPAARGHNRIPPGAVGHGGGGSPVLHRRPGTPGGGGRQAGTQGCKRRVPMTPTSWPIAPRDIAITAEDTWEKRAESGRSLTPRRADKRENISSQLCAEGKVPHAPFFRVTLGGGVVVCLQRQSGHGPAA